MGQYTLGMQRRALKGNGDLSSSSVAKPEWKSEPELTSPPPSGKVYDDGTNTFFWYVMVAVALF